MQSKEKNNKTTCTKNNALGEDQKTVVPIPDEVVAQITGASESLVKKVRLGSRKTVRGKGQKIVIAKEMWEYGSSLLIQEIKNRINL